MSSEVTSKLARFEVRSKLARFEVKSAWPNGMTKRLNRLTVQLDRIRLKECEVCKMQKAKCKKSGSKLRRLLSMQVFPYPRLDVMGLAPFRIQSNSYHALCEKGLHTHTHPGLDWTGLVLNF